jgi:hypothetical protein
MSRFVEHVDYANQPHAELRRQPDALGLAAGKRGEFAVEGQVTQAGLAEEMQPLRHTSSTSRTASVAAGRTADFA